MPVAGEGALIVMVPVVKVQFGWVDVAVACAGIEGCVLIVTFRAVEIQPKLFFTVTLYVFGFKPGKMPLVLL